MHGYDDDVAGLFLLSRRKNQRVPGFLQIKMKINDHVFYSERKKGY